MNKYLWLSFCFFLGCLSSLHAQQSQQQLESQISALEHRYWEAWRDRDAKTLAQIRAEDFREADHDGVWDKTQTEQGDLDLETTAFTMNNEKVSVLQPNVALLTYEVGYKSSYKGKDISSSHSYIASLYARRKGDWRLVYTQESLANDSQATERTAVSSKTPADQFFIEKEKEIWEALKNKDKAADSRLLADDFVGLYDTGFATKSDHVKQVDDKYSLESYNVQDSKVLRLSPKMALLLYKATCKGSGEWEQYCSRPDYVSSLWVERNGQWVDLFSQDTTAASGDESDEAVTKAIVANEQKIFETFKRNDISAFGNMRLSRQVKKPRAAICLAQQMPETKEEQKKTGLLFTGFKMEGLRLVRYSPSAATLVYRETIDGLQSGKPFEWHINSSSGYVNRGGKWVPILYQDVMAK